MRARILFVILTVCIAGELLHAALAWPEQNTSVIAHGGNAVPRFYLAHSMQALTEWKFQPGDNPAYAQPGYDDSGWKSMSIEPRANYHDPYFSSEFYVPGWTALGFPNLTGYAWYRARFQVTGSNQDLWLEMPPDVDDAYQVYANGRLVGSMGNFTANHVTPFYSHPRKFHLPAPDSNGDVVLALRFYMQPESVLWNFAAGGMHAPPAIGLSQSIALLQQRNQDVNLHTALSYPLLGLLAWIAAIAAFWIYRLDRSERAYFWLALAFAMEAVVSFSNFIASTTYWETYSANVLINDLIGSALDPLFWLLFWAYWFRLPRIRLVFRVGWALALLEVCTLICLRQPVMGTLISLGWTHDLWLFSTILRVTFALLLIAVTVGGIRQDRAEGWTALPALVLLGITLFNTDLEVIGIPVSYFPLGVRVSIGDISLFVLILVVLGLVVRRFLRSQMRQREMTHDLQQAQEVQSLLVPERLPQTPGYYVEGTYLPASQVGGDFYQVLPHAGGGLIVVLGDVSGKGLRAAMVVSIVVGAVRAIGKETTQPAEILVRLNRELAGNLKSGFVTCICARLAMDGSVAVANAGHLSPWVNGTEIETPGALPLGVLPAAEYETVTFRLNEGDTLTLMSDGVVEARREKDGQLYGFERLARLMAETPSAHLVAEVARTFGQEDDISVLNVARVGVFSSANA